MAVPTRSQVEAIIAERITATVEVVLHEESLTQIHLTSTTRPVSESTSNSSLAQGGGGGGGGDNCAGRPPDTCRSRG